MTNVLSFMDNIVSVTRFNRGEAVKIFEELKNTGAKVVMKNNAPVSVIMSPEQYQLLMEERENMGLLLEVQERGKNSENRKMYSLDDIMKQNGISRSEIAASEDPVFE